MRSSRDADPRSTTWRTSVKTATTRNPMQDITNVNNKIGLPLLILVVVETLVNCTGIGVAVIFAILHAILIYTNTIAAVKEAKQKRQWFPTVLFRNILVATLVLGLVALIFDMLLAIVMLISSIVVYIMLGTDRGSTVKQAGNSPRIDERLKYEHRIGYDHNSAQNRRKRLPDNYRRRLKQSIEVEVID